MAVESPRTHHYIQLADQAVCLDDPVDGLGALEQQDDVTVQEGIVLQRLQFHDDVHLERAADKTEEEKCGCRACVVLSCPLCLAN